MALYVAEEDVSQIVTADYQADNVSQIPPPACCRNVTDIIRFRNRASKGIPIDEAKMAELRKNHRLTIPNPLSTLRILADFEAALLLLATGMALACFYAISTGASKAFETVYGFNELEISLMFLPIGAGSLISAFTMGKMIDWNYRSTSCKATQFPVDRLRQADLSTFPIEIARVQISIPLLVIASVAIIGYGWMMDHHISLAGPVIMLFILGYTLVAGFQALNVLMIDIYPGQAATATAANNIVRCLLGAAASAAIVPMSDAMGNGWAYTLLALLTLLVLVEPLASMKYGMGWRRAMKEKAETKKARKEDEEKRKAEKL